MNHYKLKDIYVGMTESFEVTVTKEMHETFTKLTGDVNPLHLTDDYAKENGFNGRIVYGMLTASFYSTLVGVYLPGEHCLFHEIKTTFHAPVYEGDHLTIKGSVEEIHELFKRIKIKAEIRNQEGKKVSKASIIVGLTGEEGSDVND